MRKDGTTRSQIASRLRVARERAGLSQGQVARMLSMHRPSISEIEAGRRRVSAEELAKFADIYGVGIEWLTSAQDSETIPTDATVLMAARELGKLKDTDLDQLAKAILMVRNSRGKI